MPPTDGNGNPIPYTFDKDGGVIDPPIIAEYEDRIGRAAALADQDSVDLYTEEYHAERLKRAKAYNDKLAGKDETVTADTGTGNGETPPSRMNRDALTAALDEAGVEWDDSDNVPALRAKLTAHREAVTA